jgi:imidazolonepropionase
VSPDDPAGGDLLVRGIGALATNDKAQPGTLGMIETAAMAMRDGRVVWTGPEPDLPAGLGDLPELDVAGRFALPGFVDAHTHVVFAGDRSDEFARRLAGESYEQIMASGGGIMSTVAATRAATADDLAGSARRRLTQMLAAGTTTVEVKSGYGLDLDTERRILEVVAQLDRDVAIDVVPTFLAAHVVPPEWRDDRGGYVRLVIDEMLPALAPSARFCDVFCDEGAFTVDEARLILEGGKRHGLEPRLHADQLARTGATALAAEMKAVSADHLDRASPADLGALAEAGTVAVLLPGVSFTMRLPYPDPARFAAAGVPLALATDANPGTSYVLTMPFIIALACLNMGMAPDAAVWSATRGGALALHEPDRGWLGRGAVADAVVLDAPSHLHIPYRPDDDVVWKVVKSGRVV